MLLLLKLLLLLVLMFILVVRWWGGGGSPIADHISQAASYEDIRLLLLWGYDCEAMRLLWGYDLFLALFSPSFLSNLFLSSLTSLSHPISFPFHSRTPKVCHTLTPRSGPNSQADVFLWFCCWCYCWCWWCSIAFGIWMLFSPWSYHSWNLFSGFVTSPTVSILLLLFSTLSPPNLDGPFSAHQ